jgi:hypothetical protein
MIQHTRRSARAKQLLRLYLLHRQLRQRRLQRRLASANHADLKQAESDVVLESLPRLSPLLGVEGSDSSSEDDSTSSSSASWLEETTSDESEHESGDEDIPGPDPSGYMGDDDGEVGSSDDEQWSNTSDEDGNGSAGEWPRPSLGRWIREGIEAMYMQRYEVSRNQLPRGPGYLHHVLTVQKHLRPDHFRHSLRVTPRTFDRIVQEISDDPVFFNHSDQPQIAVEEQLAVTLYRFGHNGNAAGLQSVANWAGLGKGTVSLVTRRVMAAILRPRFMRKAVWMPTDVEKEEAKAWVEAHSCRAWRDGWSLVDGTLVPLAERPYWFGESYFDRKSNYSLNIQVSIEYLLPVFEFIRVVSGHVLTQPPHHRLQLWLHQKYS